MRSALTVRRRRCQPATGLWTGLGGIGLELRGRSIFVNDRRVGPRAARAVRGGRAVAIVALLGAAASCSPQASKTARDCLPEGVRAATSKPSDAFGRVQIYIDGSQSMAGYFSPAAGSTNPMADILRLVDRLGREQSVPVEFAAFGREIVAIPREAALGPYSRQERYNCRGGGCDNQESRIDNVLDGVASMPRDALSVVVTDLWLDNLSFAGSSQVALGGPLQDVLRQGKAIGVLGSMAPFAGPIFGVPGAGTYRGARERPLFVIIVGPPAAVVKLKDRLLQSESPHLAAERVRFSLFSTDMALPPLGPPKLRPIGGGVARRSVLGPGILAGVPQYRLQRGLALQQGGSIRASHDPSAAFPEGAVWSGPARLTTRVWRLSDPADLEKCAAGTWREIPRLSDAWRPDGPESGTAEFALDSRSTAPLADGNIYYVLAEMGTKGLAVPNPQTQWIRDWSLSPADSAAFAADQPETFKALNVASLAELMEREVARQRPSGVTALRFGFIVQIDR